MIITDSTSSIKCWITMVTLHKHFRKKQSHTTWVITGQRRVLNIGGEELNTTYGEKF
jgi:hypothetical protein